MKILIVEDNDRLRKSLTDYLLDEGFVVDSADNGIEALHMGMNYNYNLILLDVMLPSLCGWDVLTALRNAGKIMPILMLSARDKVEDQLQSINMGANDYITKPFEMTELVARIRAAMCPEDDKSKTEIRMGALTLNTATKMVYLNGKQVDLLPLEYSLMEMLMQSRNQVVTKFTIMQHLFDPGDDSASITLDAQMFMLRQKFGNNRIQSRNGMGYQVVALGYDMAS